jgi:hypothetical protein
MLRFPGGPVRGAVGGEAGVTAETAAFANAMIFDGSSAELREGCVRVAAGTTKRNGSTLAFMHASCSTPGARSSS